MNREQIFEIIASHAREVLPDLASHRFQSSDELKELGANSIDRSEIVMLTLESLKLQISLVEIAGAQNLGELAELLHAKKVQVA